MAVNPKSLANLRPPWPKGKSGNPLGARISLVARVREATQDGKKIVEFMHSVMSGEIKASTRDRIEAAKFLADRGHGKAPDLVLSGELSDEAREEAVALSTEELEALAAGITPQAASPIQTPPSPREPSDA